MLFVISTGAERVKEYFYHFLKEGDWFDPSNSDGEFPLTKLNPEVVDMKENSINKELPRIEIIQF